jgi:hypothetical protein
LVSLFSGGLACQSAPCTLDAVSGEYAAGGAAAAGATGGGGATAGGCMFGVYEVSKAEGAPAVPAAAEVEDAAKFEVGAEAEVLDLVCFMSSSALTSRSSCSVN